ncbi:MAG: ferredoxin reductase family protein [Mycobacteriaceae bacterium]
MTPVANRTHVRRATAVSSWQRDTVGYAVAASLLVVLALWVHGGGIAQLSAGTGESLTTLGRLTGLSAADAMLIQVLLMARIPWVERSFGQDTLVQWHRWLGFGSFTTMGLHIGLITLGYAGTGQTGLLPQVWDLVWNYPGMLLATAGSAALVMVVVTSLRAARRRLRYESWHLLHLYAYLGVGLALPHQIWTGTDFTANAWARAYWWTLYASVAASVLAFRIVVPLWRSWRHRLVVDRVVQETPGVVSVHLTGRNLDRLGVRAGQFFLWRFLDGPGSSRAHPFSLSAAPRRDVLRITAKDLGAGSARLASLRPGTRVLVEGPYGRLTDAVRTKDKLTFIAAGIGITPMRALLEELDYGPGEATLIHRTSGAYDAVFAGEITELAHHRGIRLQHLPGPRNPQDASWLPMGFSSRSDSAALLELAPDIVASDVYLCGPDPWMGAARAAARAAGVPARQIHREHFTY